MPPALLIISLPQTDLLIAPCPRLESLCNWYSLAPALAPSLLSLMSLFAACHSAHPLSPWPLLWLFPLPRIPPGLSIYPNSVVLGELAVPSSLPPTVSGAPPHQQEESVSSDPCPSSLTFALCVSCGGPQLISLVHPTSSFRGLVLCWALLRGLL